MPTAKTVEFAATPAARPGTGAVADAAREARAGGRAGHGMAGCEWRGRLGATGRVGAASRAQPGRPVTSRPVGA